MDESERELGRSPTGPPASALSPPSSRPVPIAAFCTACGAGADLDDRFCSACGNELRLPHLVASQMAPEVETDRLRRAHQLLVTGDVHGAIPLLEQLVADRPDWPALRAYLGVAYVRMARVTEAQTAIEEALGQDPHDFTCRMAYGEYYARLGFYDKAVGQLNLALTSATPGEEPYRAAFELRRFCADKAKTLFYRETALPRLPKALQRIRLSNRVSSQPIA